MPLKGKVEFEGLVEILNVASPKRVHDEKKPAFLMHIALWEDDWKR